MRHALRRLLPVMGGLVLVGWGASELTRPTRASGHDLHSELAPVAPQLATEWIPIATLDGDALDAGPIVALDMRGDTLALAHAHAVTLLVGGEIVQRFGSAVVGAPEYIARAAGIALTDEGIAVLESRAHRLDHWSPDGTRRRSQALPSAAGGAQYGTVTALDTAVLISALRHDRSGPAWWVWRVTSQGIDTLVADYAAGELGGAYRIPLVATHGDGYVLLDALHGMRWLLAADGTRHDSTARANHPRVPVPEHSRRRITDLSATLPPELRRALTFGDYAPSARALTIADGRLLVLTGDADDAVHLEVLDAAAQPIGRLWERAEHAPLFLVRGAAFRVREADASYVIERLTLTPPRR